MTAFIKAMVLLLCHLCTLPEIRSLINSRINVLPLPHAQLALAVVQEVPTPTVPSGDQTAPTCTGHITIHRLPPLQASSLSHHFGLPTPSVSLCILMRGFIFCDTLHGLYECTISPQSTGNVPALNLQFPHIHPSTLDMHSQHT